MEPNATSRASPLSPPPTPPYPIDALEAPLAERLRARPELLGLKAELAEALLQRALRKLHAAALCTHGMAPGRAHALLEEACHRIEEALRLAVEHARER